MRSSTLPCLALPYLTLPYLTLPYLMRSPRYQWDMSGGGYPYGHLSNRASASVTSPVTFHHLAVDSFELYNRMQFAQQRGPHGEVYRYDFSRWFLKEYIATSPVPAREGQGRGQGQRQGWGLGSGSASGLGLRVLSRTQLAHGCVLVATHTPIYTPPVSSWRLSALTGG